MSDERTQNILSESRPGTGLSGPGDRASATEGNSVRRGGLPWAVPPEAAVRDEGEAAGTERGFASGGPAASPSSAPVDASSPPPSAAIDPDDGGSDKPSGLAGDDTFDPEVAPGDSDGEPARPSLTGPR